MVLTQEEVRSVLSRLQGDDRLFLSLLYGTGMRLAEAQRLRVKDVDFSYDQVLIRDGKGAKDWVTMLPASLKTDLAAHLKRVKRLHEADVREGRGKVHLPYALEKKVPQRRERMGLAVCTPVAKPLPGSAFRGTAPSSPPRERDSASLPCGSAGRPGSPSPRPATPSATLSRPIC